MVPNLVIKVLGVVGAKREYATYLFCILELDILELIYCSWENTDMCSAKHIVYNTHNNNSSSNK